MAVGLLEISHKVREKLLTSGFNETEDGFITKELQIEEDFNYCPKAILYGIFNGAFGGTKESFYEQAKEMYYIFGMNSLLRDSVNTREERNWLDEPKNWDALKDWIREEVTLTVNEDMASDYYDKAYDEWNE